MIPLHDPRLRPVMPHFTGGNFVKGFVAGGCLAAFQDAGAPAARPELQRVLRYALQGGAALAAGEYAAAAFRQGDYGRVLVATVAGATGVLLIERMLRDAAPQSQEKTDGQEA